MTLAELQNAFQGAVLNRALPMPASIMPSRLQGAAERFEIYQDAYRLRLTEFLAADYPALRMVLGDEDFDALAMAYLEATPSSYRNARWYGRGLPDFMRIHAPWQETLGQETLGQEASGQETRALSDLASFERALSDAFDAADRDPIDAHALTVVAGEDQPRLHFTFQPGLSLLSLSQGVVAAHEAVMEERDVKAPSSTDAEIVLVWRDPSQQAFYRVLDEDEALALDSAKAGGSFAEICGLLGLRMPDDEAAQQAALFLIRWFGDGLIICCGCEEQQAQV